MPAAEPNRDIELSVSDFVALHNQVMEYAMPTVVVVGELSNFKVSKNRWVYFDLKDETASVRFFGTVFQLPGPLEDGMIIKVRGAPRLHPQYGFSISVQNMQPAGEGTIRRAFDLLQAKLKGEGLFDETRKRSLPYPPERIGIVASSESAAYADFMKIISARWTGMEILLADVQVQGEVAPQQITAAIAAFNEMAEPPEVIVITRGGGSSDDLWAFNTEQVTRAVAASRIPTLVAIGHEIDVSMAELAADTRASTPSNAAELLTPDRREVLSSLRSAQTLLGRSLEHALSVTRQQTNQFTKDIQRETAQAIARNSQRLILRRHMLALLNPTAILQRGYALVRDTEGRVIRTTAHMTQGQGLDVQMADGHIKVEVQ